MQLILTIPLIQKTHFWKKCHLNTFLVWTAEFESYRTKVTVLECSGRRAYFVYSIFKN